MQILLSFSFYSMCVSSPQSQQQPVKERNRVTVHQYVERGMSDLVRIVYSENYFAPLICTSELKWRVKLTEEIISQMYFLHNPMENLWRLTFTFSGNNAEQQRSFADCLSPFLFLGHLNRDHNHIFNKQHATMQSEWHQGPAAEPSSGAVPKLLK